MEKCKICGKEFKAINAVHLKTHNITMEQYAKLSDKKDQDVVSEKDSVTPKEITKTIFGEQDTNIEKPLNDLLEEFDITEKELRSIIRNYKNGEQLDVLQNIKRKQEFGERSAEELKDKDNVETCNLDIADALVHKFNFKVIKVSSKPKKTWFLKKN